MTTPPDDQWPGRDDDTVVSRETAVEPAGPPPGPPQDPEGRRIGYGMLLAILALALIAGAGLGVWLLTRDDNKKQTTTVVVTTSPTTNAAAKVAVPDLTGLKTDAAVQKLDALGLESQRTEVTSTEAPGTVVDQAPAAGQKLAKGSVVTLSVSKAAPVAVPNVVGQSEADATSALQNAGFQVNVASVPGSPKGQVTAQNPAAGTKAAKGSTVRINVANGVGGTTGTTSTGATTTKPTTTAPQPANATVPDVHGTDLQSAVQQLGSAGLLASIQYVPGTDPLGTIEQQSPAAGQTVKTRSHVTINASSGPGQKEQKTVPNTVGQTLQQAVTTVNGAGLRLIFQKLPVTDRTQAGKVVEQTPAAGKTAPQNAQVLVYIGAFKG